MKKDKFKLKSYNKPEIKTFGRLKNITMKKPGRKDGAYMAS